MASNCQKYCTWTNITYIFISHIMYICSNKSKVPNEMPNAAHFIEHAHHDSPAYPIWLAKSYCTKTCAKSAAFRLLNMDFNLRPGRAFKVFQQDLWINAHGFRDQRGILRTPNPWWVAPHWDLWNPSACVSHSEIAPFCSGWTNERNINM